MVVKPPQNPTVRNKRTLASSAPRSNESAMTRPITNPPRTLTVSVPTGKSPPFRRWTAPESQKRATDPRSPPSATRNVRNIGGRMTRLWSGAPVAALERQLLHTLARRADEARHVSRRVAVLVHHLVRVRDLVERERLAEAGIDLAGDDEIVQAVRLRVVREV